MCFYDHGVWVWLVPWKNLLVSQARRDELEAEEVLKALYGDGGPVKGYDYLPPLPDVAAPPVRPLRLIRLGPEPVR